MYSRMVGFLQPDGRFFEGGRLFENRTAIIFWLMADRKRASSTPQKIAIPDF
jgi:hypothetical protein